MSWQLEWQALSRKVAGFLEAVRLAGLLETQATDGREEYIRRILLPLGQEIWTSISVLLSTFSNDLPQSVKSLMDRYGRQFAEAANSSSAQRKLQGIALILAAARTELDYVAEDREQAIVTSVERAFEHLQRLIVVDPYQRQLWSSAFENREVDCEALGATHLLMHRIWAFKANSRGERTDLVLGNAITEEAAERVQATGSSLVLTEWKRAKSESEVSSALEQAERQLAAYTRGSLAGIELRSSRYVVVVTGRQATLPKGTSENSVWTRYVNIATNPLPPSLLRS